MRLSDFKVLTFDCYGTLIDWETGMLAALGPLAARSGRGLTQDEILAAHARHESGQQLQTPAMRYSDLLATVFKRLAEQWGVHASHEDCAAYGRSVGEWPAFADSPGALAYLKQHYRLVILSNVDNRGFEGSARRLGVVFDAVVTAEDAGSYKPAMRNFEYLMERLGGMGVARTDILHTAESLFHDHAPANAFGLASCWIHRRHKQEGFGATMDPGAQPHTDFRFTSLEAMAAAHRAELQGSASG